MNEYKLDYLLSFIIIKCKTYFFYYLSIVVDEACVLRNNFKELKLDE